MGCGCKGGKGAMRGVGAGGRRPVVSPRQRSIQGGQAAGPTPSELRALSLQQGKKQRSASGMDQKRRELERRRRQAIQKKLGRP